jgi:hypothetical protein
MSSSYYGVIVPRFWNGTTGRVLRERGGRAAQLLGVYLISNDYTNMLGLYQLKLRDIEDDVGLSRSEITAAFHTMRQDSVEFAYYDYGTSYVWVREMVRFRLGLKEMEPLKRDDKKALGAQRLYSGLPVNPWLGPFYDRFHRTLHLRGRRAGPAVDLGPEANGTEEGASKGLARGFEGASKPVDQKRSDQILDPLESTERRTSLDPPPPTDHARERARAAAAAGRVGKVVFRGHRLKIHDFTEDDLRLMLGAHAEGFDLRCWYDTLYRRIAASDVVVPMRDGGAWVLEQTVIEARRRGLPVATRDASAVVGKSTSRLAHAISNIKREARR